MNDFANMTKDQIDALVQSEVEKALSSRDEVHARQAMEEALNEAKEVFEALKASVQEKQTKIEEYEAILANLELDPTAAEVAANEKVVELESELEDWRKRAEVAEAALITLHQEEIAATRMQELEEAGVTLDDDSKVQEQYAKIREMSDDQFESYKGELVALKAKYYSAPEGEGDEEGQGTELSSEEINQIAQTLGCDPSDSDCVSTVREVAVKVAEVSAANKKKKGKMPPFMKKNMMDKEDCENEGEEPGSDSASEGKEVASVQKKLTLGEAISRSVDQTITAPADMKQELASLWADLDEARREEKTRKTRR